MRLSNRMKKLENKVGSKPGELTYTARERTPKVLLQGLLCGTKHQFAAFAQKAASMRFADLHLGLHTRHIQPAIKALIQIDNLSISPSLSER